MVKKKKRKNQEDYYVEKFGQKMRGNTFATAVGWVEGIGTLNKKQKAKVLQKIKNKYYPYLP